MFLKPVIISLSLVTLCLADIGLELQKDPNYQYSGSVAPLSHDHSHGQHAHAASADNAYVGGAGSYDSGSSGASYDGSSGASYDGSAYSAGAGAAAGANDVAATDEEVQKHFYVFGANEEEEEVAAAPTVVQAGKKQTHYKIIFIKAPSQDRAHQQILAQAPKRDEKTIVYVLVKKPEDVAQVIQQQQEAYKPNKPEVFFIKYKGGKGGAAAAAGSGAGALADAQGGADYSSSINAHASGAASAAGHGGSYGPRFASEAQAEAEEQIQPRSEDGGADEQFSLSSLVPSRTADTLPKEDTENEQLSGSDDAAVEAAGHGDHAGASDAGEEEYLPPARH